MPRKKSVKEEGVVPGEYSVFEDKAYNLKSKDLISESLKKGFDVAQFPNGDIVVGEVMVTNVKYTWDPKRKRLFKRSAI